MANKELVLVTGANGFVGSHLVEALLAQGYAVRCLVRRTSDLAFIQDLPVEWAYGDIARGDGLEAACEGIDAVCHLAGATKARDRETYFRVNESRPPRPLTWYGQSKLQGEQFCHEYEDRLPVVILRAAAVYGPRERDIYFYFQMVNRGLKLLLGRGERRASFIFVQDFVTLILRALEDERAAGQIYFAAEGRDYDWREVSEMVAEALGKRAARVTLPEWLLPVIAAAAGFQARITKRPALLNEQKLIELRQPYWVCSAEKARRELGFEAQHDLATGLRLTAQWYRENGWL
ncbi:MAG: hypothetical protein B6I34_06145 [Anaerolineaceae bacterium 4572_32.1]|nr:MAG: hypothetical protein B6I34_06145 [Anaerolineaceae bacterium 4572_32.1]